MVNQLTSGPLAAYWGNSVMVRLVGSRREIVRQVQMYYFPKLAIVHSELVWFYAFTKYSSVFSP